MAYFARISRRRLAVRGWCRPMALFVGSAKRRAAGAVKAMDLADSSYGAETLLSI